MSIPSLDKEVLVQHPDHGIAWPIQRFLMEVGDPQNLVYIGYNMTKFNWIYIGPLSWEMSKLQSWTKLTAVLYLMHYETGSKVWNLLFGPPEWFEATQQQVEIYKETRFSFHVNFRITFYESVMDWLLIIANGRILHTFLIHFEICIAPGRGIEVKMAGVFCLGIASY